MNEVGSPFLELYLKATCEFIFMHLFVHHVYFADISINNIRCYLCYLTLSAALDAVCVHCRDSVTALWTQAASTANIFFKYSW